MNILVLVASDANLPLIQFLKDEGHYVITCDNNKHNQGHSLADENLFIDVYDYETIFENVKSKNLDAIFSFVSEHGIITKSILDDRLKLNGIGLTSITILLSKFKFRAHQKSYNLNHPKFEITNFKNLIRNTNLNYPFIVKTENSSGSSGVFKISNREDLQALSTKERINGSVIVEDYLVGEEVLNIECIIREGKIIAFISGKYVFDKKVSEVLPVACIFDYGLDLLDIEEIEKTLNSLEISNGVFNTEIIKLNNKPYIIEINPRPSGNYLWKLLETHYEMNFLEFYTSLFTKDNFYIQFKKNTQIKTAYFLIYSRKKKIFNVFKLPFYLKNDLLFMKIDKIKGDSINEFKCLHDRVGVFLMKFNEEETCIINKIGAYAQY